MARSAGHQQEEGSSASRTEDHHVDTQADSQPTQKGPRKRTKTGCLTCRRRRIKCGEEKPICSNCTKSKRYCEGYHTRIVFRQPSSGSGPTDDVSNVRPPHLSHFASFEGYNPAYPRLNTGASSQPLRPIAPTPLQAHEQNYHAARGPASISSRGPFVPTLTSASFVAGPSPIPLSTNAPGTFETGSHYALEGGMRDIQYGPMQHHAPVPAPDPVQNSWSGAIAADELHDRPFMTRENTLSSFNTVPNVSTSQLPSGVFPPMALPDHAVPSPFGSLTDNTTPLTSTQIAALCGQPLSADHPFYSEVREHIHGFESEAAYKEHDPTRYTAQGFVQRPSFNLSIPTTFESPPSAWVPQPTFEEDEDADDPWDVDLEFEEGNIQPSEQSRRDLNGMLIRHASHVGRQGTRSFTTFLNHKNVLATYRPSHAALPQADEKAARIFCHFVSSTGPSLTIFERSAPGQFPSAGIGAISGFQQPLWTYTLPSLALHHPPLMHAMLALSALHISKLQQTSPGPSIKHFTYALRRIGRLIGLPKWRNEVTTFAANLLLGFYEVMSAETSKWNIHLTGARVLAMEIDFAGKTRKIRALRAEAKSRLAQLDPENQSDYLRHAGIPESLLVDRDWEVDEDLISTFTGCKVRYDYQYQTNVSQATHQCLDFTSRDVELYKMQADLYWWYCKQDIFQSMISGNRLLMRYDHWVFCPPRGQLGQLDIIYATMDHLCLIMARLADFGGKDQVRKRRVMAAQNTQPAGQVRHPPGAPPAGKGPPMGYMPTPDNPTPMHSAFAAMSANLYDPAFSPPPTFFQPSVQASEGVDLEAETMAALTEHAAISQALDIFEQSLPPEYQPLPQDAAPPISTPFGPALQYRTHTISCIWAFYYSGRILLHRLHPHMPPAAMISAQAAAAQTAIYAQIIGKICAGLYYPQQYNLQTGSLNPSLGGALIESTFSLFFAAIQFQDHAQRGWTINKLKEIARLSGWQTAAAVAAGCEFAWEATGKAGRGPPYTPTMDWRNKDERVGDKAMKRAAKAQQQREQAVERERERERKREQGLPEQGKGQEEEEDEEEMEKRRERKEQYFVAAGKDGPSRRRKKVRTGSGAEGEPGAGGGEEDEAEPEAITHDRESIGTNPYARTHWALGLLSLDEDIAKIDLGKG